MPDQVRHDKDNGFTLNNLKVTMGYFARLRNLKVICDGNDKKVRHSLAERNDKTY